MDTERFFLFLVSGIFLSGLIFSGFSDVSEGSKKEVESFRSLHVFRADDISSAYSSSFNRTNEIFVSSLTPVTYAVIPRAIMEKENTSRHCRRFREVKEKNPKLVHFSLHGFEHSLEEDPPTEFAGKSSHIQREKIVDGKKFFQRCFDRRPSVLVPPGNTYDNTTLEVMGEQGMSLISGWEGYPGSTELSLKEQEKAGEIYQISVDSMYVKNWSTGETLNYSLIKDEVEDAHRERSIHVQMIHPGAFNNNEEKSGFDTLRKQIKQTKHMDTKTLNLIQLEKILQGQRLEFDEGKDLWTLEA